MLFEEPRTQELLRRIVRRLNRIGTGQEDDLVQEGMIHLWHVEERRPNQSPSWYFQSCQFHLLNHLRSGRSVDSSKRGQQQVAFPAEHTETATLQMWINDGAGLSQVSAQEIVGLLERWLTPSKIPVLRGLAEGFGVREIARRIGTSHQTVSKHRRSIARLATQLGITPACQ
jgi:RNA polymerase sigma factor (sigma-70 family)